MKYRLVKHKTDDGLMEIHADVPLGKVYDVIPDSEKEAEFYNTEKKKIHKKIVVSVDEDPVTFLPLELLERMPTNAIVEM